jgi:hypothetical protein
MAVTRARRELFGGTSIAGDSAYSIPFLINLPWICGGDALSIPPKSESDFLPAADEDASFSD